jgi:hypothetical protein
LSRHRQTRIDWLVPQSLGQICRIAGDYRPTVSHQLCATPYSAVAFAESRDWVVDAKPAFAEPSHVLRYLGRYTPA